jgi:hypothetical protein
MALYLGDSEKLKVYLDGVEYTFNIFSTTLILNGVLLLSSEGYILKDSNGLYLTAKESE